ncbi:hypothetical protein T552_03137 [Pneumocystis carinii B80]|uniref:Phosphotyrosine protein phosphatase I domain-containing protein n=1 Tax=Pneumocystis carinii (strain B80) TaxID=1408658 RepID=A0A0W4ZBY3_PNEC8|nr:hypothetical protein T552_03137 [Pneumocystis carinii B80]KTW25863.1 hypothetical protein T552_03137 [Pneumocystis carinii B80]
MSSYSDKINVLFVCLGNICRSPMSQGVFADYVVKHNLQDRFGLIDSCGTSAYHIGSKPDSRTLSVLQKNGINLNHRARQLHREDFKNFDYILVMDTLNLEDVNYKRPKDCHAKIKLFGDYGMKNEERIVYDPYYGGIEDFEKIFTQLSSFSEGFCYNVLGK